MDYYIRKAERKDISEISKLLYQVNKVHSDARPDIFKSETRKYSDKEVLEIISCEKTSVFVAESNGVVAGYAFCVDKQFINDNNMTDIKTLYVDDLCVDENFRGKGVGKSLFDYVYNYAEEHGYYNVTLNVWADNKNAVEFYKKLGLGVQKMGLEKIIKRD